MRNNHRQDAEQWQNCYDLLFGNREKNIEAILPESANIEREILNSLFNYWQCHSEKMTLSEFRPLKLKAMPKGATNEMRNAITDFLRIFKSKCVASKADSKETIEELFVSAMRDANKLNHTPADPPPSIRTDTSTNPRTNIADPTQERITEQKPHINYSPPQPQTPVRETYRVVNTTVQIPPQSPHMREDAISYITQPLSTDIQSKNTLEMLVFTPCCVSILIFVFSLLATQFQVATELFFLLSFVIPTLFLPILYKFHFKAQKNIFKNAAIAIIYLLIFSILLASGKKWLVPNIILMILPFLFGLKYFIYKKSEFQLSTFNKVSLSANLLCTILSFIILLTFFPVNPVWKYSEQIPHLIQKIGQGEIQYNITAKQEVQSSNTPSQVTKKQNVEPLPPLDIAGVLTEFKKDVIGFAPEQQETLSLCMEWLCRYEEFARARDNNDTAAQNQAKSQMETLQTKIKNLDITAWEAANYGVGPEIVNLVKQGKRRNLPMFGRKMIQHYQQRFNQKQNFTQGIITKAWTGWNHTKWSSDFINYPNSDVSINSLNSEDVFNPGSLEIENPQKGKMTLCYQGYIYVPDSGKYKFAITHPSVPSGWSCGGYSLYLNNSEQVNLINHGYNPRNNIERTFEVKLQHGFHKIMLINEINWACPAASHIQISIRYPDNISTRIKKSDLYIKVARTFHINMTPQTLKLRESVINPKQSMSPESHPVKPQTRQDSSNQLQQADVVKSEANKTPKLQQNPLRESSKAELEQRFKNIITSVPLRFELYDFAVSPQSFPIVQGNNALGMKIDRVRGNRRNIIGLAVDTVGQLAGSYEIYKVPYKVNLRSYFKVIYNGRRRSMICPIMRDKLIESEIGKNIIPASNNQIEKIHNQIFSTFASAQTIEKRLDELENNIDKYNIARYSVSVKLVSYSEEHKLVSKITNKIKFEIHTKLNVEVSIYDKLNKSRKIFNHELTTRTPGNMTFSRPRQSTADIRWDRKQVFEISAEKLASLLVEDFQKIQGE